MMMSRLEIILKNGVTIEILCEHWKVNTSTLTGKICSYEFNKCTKSTPIYIDIDEIIAIIEKERI